MILPQAFYNGDILPLEEIKISPTDLGIQRGYSVFDFFKLINGENPWFQWYMDRLEHSATEVLIEIPYSRIELKRICTEVLKSNSTRKANVKIILSAGNSHNGYHKQSGSSILVLGLPIHKPDQRYYDTGAKLMLRNYTRELPSVKSTNYLASAMLATQMTADDTVDVLYHNNTTISECSRCSFFIVKKGKIITSKTNVLNGITRKRLLSIDEFSDEILVKDIKLTDLQDAEEAFISSSSKGIMPVIQIEEQKIGNGLVGPISQRCMKCINSF